MFLSGNEQRFGLGNLSLAISKTTMLGLGRATTTDKNMF